MTFGECRKSALRTRVRRARRSGATGSAISQLAALWRWCFAEGGDVAGVVVRRNGRPVKVKVDRDAAGSKGARHPSGPVL